MKHHRAPAHNRSRPPYSFRLTSGICSLILLTLYTAGATLEVIETSYAQDTPELTREQQPEVEPNVDLESSSKVRRATQTHTLSADQQQPDNVPSVVSSDAERLFKIQPEGSDQGQKSLEGPHLPLNESEVRLSFSHGCNAYVYGSYKEAVTKLTRLVRPQVLLNTSEDLETAYKYLGLAHFYLDQKELAQEFLRDLLYLNPQHKFDAAKIPPNAMSFINQLRLELQSKISQRQSALNQQRELNKRRELERSRQLIILEQQVNQRLVAFVPFGAGQFQNRDQGLGYFFLASEVIAVGMSAGFFWGVESLRLPNGRYSKDNYAFVQQLQRAQVISGGVAVGLMISGVIHALLNFKKRHDVGNYLDSDLQYEDDITSGDDDDPQFRIE